MTSEQMFYGVSIPIVVFLISTFLSNRSLTAKLEGLAVRLDGRIDGLTARLNSIDSKLAVIEGDLRTFHSVTGRLEGRLDEINKR